MPLGSLQQIVVCPPLQINISKYIPDWVQNRRSIEIVVQYCIQQDRAVHATHDNWGNTVNGLSLFYFICLLCTQRSSAFPKGVGVPRCTCPYKNKHLIILSQGFSAHFGLTHCQRADSAVVMKHKLNNIISKFGICKGHQIKKRQRPFGAGRIFTTCCKCMWRASTCTNAIYCITHGLHGLLEKQNGVLKNKVKVKTAAPFCPVVYLTVTAHADTLHDFYASLWILSARQTQHNKSGGWVDSLMMTFMSHEPHGTLTRLQPHTLQYWPEVSEVQTHQNVQACTSPDCYK